MLGLIWTNVIDVIVTYSVSLFTSDNGGGICFVRAPAFVCLYVCLCAILLKNAIWMKYCVSRDVGTWTNWLTFEPHPDRSPGLLSPIAYALQRGILLRRENLYWARAAAATRRFESSNIVDRPIYYIWYALQRGVLLRLENPTYWYSASVDAWFQGVERIAVRHRKGPPSQRSDVAKVRHRKGFR